MEIVAFGFLLHIKMGGKKNILHKKNRLKQKWIRIYSQSLKGHECCLRNKYKFCSLCGFCDYIFLNFRTFLHPISVTCNYIFNVLKIVCYTSSKDTNRWNGDFSALSNCATRRNLESTSTIINPSTSTQLCKYWLENRNSKTIQLQLAEFTKQISEHLLHLDSLVLFWSWLA